MINEYTLCFKSKTQATIFINRYLDDPDVAIINVGTRYTSTEIGLDPDGVPILSYTPMDGHYLVVLSRKEITSSALVDDTGLDANFM